MFMFDFDGVLIDSTPEIMVSAYNTVASSLKVSQDDLPRDFIELFIRWRGYALNGADMVALAEFIRSQEREVSMTRERLVEFRKSCGSVLKLQRALFDARAAFLRKDSDAWFAHNRPFEPLWSMLLEGYFKDFIIVTNKNREAVQQICGFYGLELEDSRVLSGDDGDSKLSRVLDFLQIRPAEKIVYVEDAIGNLEEIMQGLADRISVRGILVTWGALAPGDAERASALGAECIDLKKETLSALSSSL